MAKVSCQHPVRLADSVLNRSFDELTKFTILMLVMNASDERLTAEISPSLSRWWSRKQLQKKLNKRRSTVSEEVRSKQKRKFLLSRRTSLCTLPSSDRATGAPLFCFGIEIVFHSFSPAPTALSRRITILRRWAWLSEFTRELFRWTQLAGNFNDPAHLGIVTKNHGALETLSGE